MKRKNFPGHSSIRASMTQPRTKNVRVVRLSVPITSPGLRRFTKSKLAKNSALPNTAGMTVVKLNVVQKKYSRGVKISAPTYIQFWVRRFSSSKIHQKGAETRKSSKYLRELRVSNDVPVRQSTKPSMARQYPSHSGKKPHWVRGPCKAQLRAQKIRR